MEVNSLLADRTSYFGHILSKDEEIFTNLHFGCLSVASLWVKSELPQLLGFGPPKCNMSSYIIVVDGISSTSQWGIEEYLGLNGLFVKKSFRREISRNRLHREHM